MKQDLPITIAQKALELFKTNGIKSVRMDDIAHSLGISKRTLYEVYPDKETLLLECVKLNSMRLEQQRLDYVQHAEGMMDIVVFYIRQQLEELSRCSQSFFVEAVRYVSVQNFLQERRNREMTLREAFLKKGIRQGYFSTDLNYKLLERISHMVAIELIDVKAYKDYSLQDIFQTFILVFLRGILTEKGLKDLNKYLKSPTNT